MMKQNETHLKPPPPQGNIAMKSALNSTFSQFICHPIVISKVNIDLWKRMNCFSVWIVKLSFLLIAVCNRLAVMSSHHKMHDLLNYFNLEKIDDMDNLVNDHWSLLILVHEFFNFYLFTLSSKAQFLFLGLEQVIKGNSYLPPTTIFFNNYALQFFFLAKWWFFFFLSVHLALSRPMLPRRAPAWYRG